MTPEEALATERKMSAALLMIIILIVSTIGSLMWGLSQKVERGKMRIERDAVIRACQERGK